MTNGCFDLIHVGHVRYLQEAKHQGDVLIVALNTDQSARSLKGPQRPIVPEDERAEILAALACVDYVILFDEPTPLRLIEKLIPHVLVKGGDWQTHRIVGAQVVENSGGKVLSIPMTPGRSTSNLIEKILQMYQ
jgi:D-beta-D-heptose 7-phosphate kinase/D-beta-D-heptose 1-phosphate adenosyltransferase